MFSVTVRSPQLSREVQYALTVQPPHIAFHQTDPLAPPNVFVERTVLLSLSMASRLVTYERLVEALGAGLVITLEGDNEFYSRPSETFDSAPKLHKTGLGSSAALVTSLSGALLCHTGACCLDGSEDREMAHRTAQICHCLAQGKVGSGFDVCAASYGSQTYTRFDPTVLSGLMTTGSCVDVETLFAALRSPLWNHDLQPLALPDGLALLLGDVGGGSETPGMVRQILAWKKKCEEEEDGCPVWKQLGALNHTVEEIFADLHTCGSRDPHDYRQALEYCAHHKAAEWSHNDTVAAKLLARLHDTFRHVRHFLRVMGEQAGVPVEPIEQTRLLDTTMEVPGVVLAGVPGAGGHDAVFAIVVGSTSGSEVEELWAHWHPQTVCRLAVREQARGVSVDRSQ